MTSPSEHSAVDNDRFSARIEHVIREHSPQPRTHGGAETDFAAVGGQFCDRRSSYPHHIDISEGEETDRQPRSPMQAEASLGALPITGRPSLGSPPTTPTPNRDHYAPYVHPSDICRVIRGRKRRRPSSGMLLLSSSFSLNRPLFYLFYRSCISQGLAVNKST
jgi:hypothetical protein